MSGMAWRIPCALEVRILRFIYENGPSSIDEFYERSGFRDEGRSHFSALDGFRDAAEKGLVAAVEVAHGTELRYHALIKPLALRALLIRNAVVASFEAQTEEFRELMAEFAKLPRE
jgi:hypothetical protein